MSQHDVPARRGTPGPSAAAGRTERKRSITRWNRRLGLALVVIFPLSYLPSWLHDQRPDGTLGAWLSAGNVLIQVLSSRVLFTRAAYSFYVFGFPSPRASPMRRCCILTGRTATCSSTSRCVTATSNRASLRPT